MKRKLLLLFVFAFVSLSAWPYVDKVKLGDFPFVLQGSVEENGMTFNIYETQYVKEDYVQGYGVLTSLENYTFALIAPHQTDGGVVPYSGDIRVPIQVEFEDVIYNVEGVDAYAFSNCPDLETVYFMLPLSYIGRNAFYNCPRLTDIFAILAANYYTLNTYVRVVDDVFTGCPNATVYASPKVDAPSEWHGLKVTCAPYYDEENFYRYRGNNKILCPKRKVCCRRGEYDPYYNELVLIVIDEDYRHRVADVNNVRFQWVDNPYEGKTRISMPDESFSGVDDDLFLNNTTLRIFDFNGTENYIGSSAFEGCSNLTQIYGLSSLPLVSVGDRAFYGCNNLQFPTGYELPSTLKTIGSDAFRGLSQLTSISSLPSATEQVGSGAFRGTGITTMTFWGVNDLGSDAFRDCASLASVTARNLEMVPDGCFRGCSSLEVVHLESEEGRNPVTYIGDRAFYGCNAIENFYIGSPVPPETGIEAFPGTAEFTGNPWLYVPAGSAAAYGSTDPWTRFNYIEEELITIDGLDYEVDSENFTAKVISHSLASDVTKVVIPNVINVGGIEMYVTEITENSFADMTNLRTVVINAMGLTNVEKNAFCNCTRLKEVYCCAADPTAFNLQAFGGCSALTSFFVYGDYYDDYVQTVRTTAFVAESKLKSMTSNYYDGNFFWSLNDEFYTARLEPVLPGLGTPYKTGGLKIPEFVDKEGVTYTVESINSRTISTYEETQGDITDVLIPSSIISLGECNFEGMSLEALWVDNVEPPYVPGYLVDDEIPWDALYVPKGCVDTYLGDSNWADYIDAIYEWPIMIDGVWYTREDNGDDHLLNFAVPFGGYGAKLVLQKGSYDYDGQRYELNYNTGYCGLGNVERLFFMEGITDFGVIQDMPALAFIYFSADVERVTGVLRRVPKLAGIYMPATVPPVLATWQNADPWREIDPSTITLKVPEGSVAAYQASSLWNQFNIEGMTLGVSSESIPSKRYIGDVNNDGNISVEEVARLAELVAEKREYDPRRYDVTGDGLFTIGDMAIITSKLPGGPSEWISSNGTHDYVDLDLPSGTLWATCNVGAASPSEVGCAFAWGETATKHFYFEENYFDTDDLCKTTFKYSSYSGDGLKTELDPEDDAATVLWGNMWQTPSNDQLQELLECATWTQVDEPVKGYWVKSKKDDAKRIFLPKAKYAYAVSRELMSVDGEFLPGTLALYRRCEPMFRFVELPVRPVLKYSSNQ